MRPYWIRVGPESKDWCPYKGEDAQMGREEGHVRWM